MAKHRDPGCTGTWVFDRHDDMGVTFINCSECGAGTRDKAAAKHENRLAEVLRDLTKDGKQFLKVRLTRKRVF